MPNNLMGQAHMKNNLMSFVGLEDLPVKSKDYQVKKYFQKTTLRK